MHQPTPSANWVERLDIGPMTTANDLLVHELRARLSNRSFCYSLLWKRSGRGGHVWTSSCSERISFDMFWNRNGRESQNYLESAASLELRREHQSGKSMIVVEKWYILHLPGQCEMSPDRYHQQHIFKSDLGFQ